MPPLPFEYGDPGTPGYIAFTADRLIYQGKHPVGYREVPYSHIKRVEIVHTRNSGSHVAIVESGKTPVELWPSGWLYDGSLNLVFLKLLWQLAPQARFIGETESMKAGWVPRLFNSSSYVPNNHAPIAELPSPHHEE